MQLNTVYIVVHVLNPPSEPSIPDLNYDFSADGEDANYILRSGDCSPWTCHSHSCSSNSTKAHEHFRENNTIHKHYIANFIVLILHREFETLKQEALGPPSSIPTNCFKFVLIILIIKLRVWIYYYYIDNNSIELLLVLEVQYYYIVRIVSLMCHQAKLN